MSRGFHLERTARCYLAVEVFEVFLKETQTFEEDNIGSGLAYLMAAILKDDEYMLVDDPKYALFESILHKNFPKHHEVWKFIR